MKEQFVDEELGARWERLLKIRGAVTKALEIGREKGLLGNSLQAKVAVYPASGEDADFLEGYAATLPTLFIVSQVELHSPGEDLPDDVAVNEDNIAIAVRRADGEKCNRCWNYSEAVGESEQHPSLCARCIGELGGPNE
jgi:isoleucyl-tRNA synthetase